jgi:hypothetical protein
MTPRTPPGVLVRILDRILPDEPLAGDLLEAAATRSRLWLCAQIALAVLFRAGSAFHTHKRMTIEAILLTGAMLLLLGFYAVVVATLLGRALALDQSWAGATGRYAAWQFFATAPSFVIAVGIGRAIARLHPDHRVAAIVAFAASAAAAAFLNLYLFVTDAMIQPFVPYAFTQSAVSAVFIAGLFFGFGRVGARQSSRVAAV